MVHQRFGLSPCPQFFSINFNVILLFVCILVELICNKLNILLVEFY